ncbi:hypothetical protein DSECCO2_584930 [anaerobic digester metagenome]
MNQLEIPFSDLGGQVLQGGRLLGDVRPQAHCRGELHLQAHDAGGEMVLQAQPVGALR